MSKRTGRAMVVVGAAAFLALPGILGGFTPAFATTANDSCFISAINSARAGNGLGALGVNSALESIATTWTQSMVAAQVLSHNLNLPNVAPSDWVNLGENVGEGPSCDAIATAFMNSPEHRANILDTAYSVVGVGVVVDGNGTMWVTEDFMGTGSPVSAPAPPPAPKPVTPSTPAPVHTTAPAAPAKTIATTKPSTPSTPAESTPAAPPATAPPPAPATSQTQAAPAAEPITVPTAATPIVQVMARTDSAPAHPGKSGHKGHGGIVHHLLSAIASFFGQL